MKMKRRSPLEQPHVSDLARVARANEALTERQYLEPEELLRLFRVLSTKPYSSPFAQEDTTAIGAVGDTRVGSFWYAYFFLQYHYGCRLSEPALILEEDVSVKKKLIVIRRLKKSTEAEGFLEVAYPASERVLRCVSAVRAWKRARSLSDNPFLFATFRRREGSEVGAERLSKLRSLDGWQAVSRFTTHRVFLSISRLSRLPDGLRNSYALRHTRAVMLLADGQDPREIQKALSYFSVKQVERYARVAQGVSARLRQVREAGLL